MSASPCAQALRPHSATMCYYIHPVHDARGAHDVHRVHLKGTPRHLLARHTFVGVHTSARAGCLEQNTRLMQRPC